MKTARQLSIALIAAIVLIVIIGGIMLLNDPSGRIFQLSLDDVRNTFIKDFGTLAWLLMLSVGLAGIVAIVQALSHQAYYPKIFIAEGILLLIWCIIFIAFISDSILIILIFGLVGAALILLGRLISKQQKNIAEHHVAHNESRHPHHDTSHKKSHYHKHKKRGH